MCGDGHAHEQDGFPSTECTTNISTQYSPQLISQLSDAHCHIQDDRQNIYALVASWKNGTNTDTTVAPLHAENICLMGVQPSKDLGLDVTQDSPKEAQEAIESLTLNTYTLSSSATPTNIVKVSWNDTDTKGDWDLVSKLAHDYPDRFVPSFGIHPWFTHKYQPMQEKDSNAVEIGGARRHGRSATTTEGTSAEAEPTLSFSSTALTPVPEPGVGREAFLAMSKQLQEKMAKESRERELGQSQATTTTESSHQPQDASKDHEAADESNDKEVPIQLSSHLQYQDQTLSISPKLAHYQQVLQVPNSAPSTYLPDLAARLPEPRALEPAMKELRRKLEEHPNAVLGEIGLDRTARVPEPSIPTSTTDTPDDSFASGGQKKTTLALTSIQHQLNLVREQLKVAASLDRAASFHCVQAYGHWHDFLIQEGKRLKQMEAGQEYRRQLQQIHASGGTPTVDISSLLGGQEAGGARLSKQGVARLRREAREAEWERHVASTVQESSDEEDEDSEDETFGGSSSSSGERKKRGGSNSYEPTAPAPLVLPPLPVFEKVLPPRLCMHSYGGSVDMMRAFTKMDHPPEIFFSFSILINGRLQERKLQELISAVPEDRLLIESDHHSHMLVDGLLMDMVKKVSEIRGWSIEETVQKTTRNWHRFVYGH